MGIEAMKARLVFAAVALLTLVAASPSYAQGAGGFQYPFAPWRSYAPADIQCGKLVGANFNVTTDQPITISVPSGVWAVAGISITDPSVSMTTAAGGFYTGAGKTGITVVSNAQAYSALTTKALNTSGNYLEATLGTLVEFGGYTSTSQISTLYFSLTTPQGSAATANIRVRCKALY
jgi:hypothetical protein